MSARIAHIFEPWEWKSRHAVVVLLLAVIALGVVSVAIVIRDAVRLEINLAYVVMNSIYGLAYWVVFLRPALQNLPRWDELNFDKTAVPF